MLSGYKEAAAGGSPWLQDIVESANSLTRDVTFSLAPVGEQFS